MRRREAQTWMSDTAPLPRSTSDGATQPQAAIDATPATARVGTAAIGAMPLHWPNQQFWDPVLKFHYPMDLRSNVRARLALNTKADGDEALQAKIVEMCRASFWFWCFHFAYTYRIRTVHTDGSSRPARFACYPFLLYPRQAQVAQDAMRAVMFGEPLCIDKSRDQGASWLVLTVFDWFFLFFTDQQFMVLSRNLNLVDGSGKHEPYMALGSANSLFWKLDFLHQHLPPWMAPGLIRSRMRIERPEARSWIQGEASTSSAGQAGRAKAIMFDEFARMREGHAILTSARDTAACRIFVSTPGGPGTAHSAVRFSGKVKVSILGWWDNPEQARDRAIETRNDGRQWWSSTWYRKQVSRAVSRREIAENLDIDHGAAGARFFDTDILAMHQSTYGGPPKWSGWIDWSESLGRDDERLTLVRQIHERTRLVDRDKYGLAPWQWWCSLYDDVGEEVRPGDFAGYGRPAQDQEYVFGLDIGNGLGASNSTIAVGKRTAWGVEQVGSFASAMYAPHDFAILTLAAAAWVGGIRPPLVIFEANGPGQAFAVEWLKWGYARTWRRKAINIPTPQTRDDIGWWSDPVTKHQGLALLRGNMARGKVILRDIPAVAEAGTYVYLKSGDIAPLTEKRDDDETDSMAEAPHGDRVIACMCMVIGGRDIARYDVDSARNASPAPRRGTMSERLRANRKRARRGGRDE